MTGLHLRTGWPVARVRLGIEVAVLALGWLLGGTVGLGTALFAVLIGPAVAQGLAVAGVAGGTPTTPGGRGASSSGASGESAPEHPHDAPDDGFPELDA
jgi:hypothetical protein